MSSLLLSTKLCTTSGTFDVRQISDDARRDIPTTASSMPNLGGDIGLLVNWWATIDFLPWRFERQPCIMCCVTFVNDDEHEELMTRKVTPPQTRFGDCYDSVRVEQINKRF